MFNLLNKCEFVHSTKKLKNYLILHEFSENRTSVREISRKYGFSPGLTSEYIAELKTKNLVEEDNHLTKKGQLLLKNESQKLRNEFLMLSGVFKASLNTEEIKVAAVASFSSFAMSEINQILASRVNINLFSRGYEAVEKYPDAHYYILGNIPAMKLNSFGMDLEFRMTLLPEQHLIIGKPENSSLCIIGQSSVSNSLFQTGLFFEIEILKKYSKVVPVENLKLAYEWINKGKGDALLWEPFASYFMNQYKLGKIYSFPQAEVFTQILAKNNKIFLEKELQDVFEQNVDEVLSKYKNKIIEEKNIDQFIEEHLR